MMRNPLILTLMLGFAASSGFAQANLPQTGSCVHFDTFMGSSLTTKIEWSGDDARITSHIETLKGKVIGLRAHDENFKLSILFEDPITGPSEMTVFGATFDGTTKHRRAIIGYDILPDGTRVVGNVSAFEDITCSVLE